MKKVIFILALVLAYGVSISSANVKTVGFGKAKTTIVADTDNLLKPAPADDKKDKKVKKATTASKAKSGCCAAQSSEKTGCSAARQKSCSASQKSCPAAAKKQEKQ